MKHKIIFKALVGSHSHGTATSESDEDFSGVYLQDNNDILSYGYEEYVQVNKDEKYFEVIDKVMELGGVNTWIKTKDKKYEILIDDIEPSTSLIRYKIKEPYLQNLIHNKWNTKVGKTDIDSLISMIYNEKLFNMMEHLDKFSILRNKTFL